MENSDLLQNELQSCLLEIEQVEKELEIQLRIIGDNVDKGYHQLNYLRSSLGLIGNLIVGVGGMVSNVKAARAHNKALRSLMEIKKNVANEKSENVKKIKLIIDKVVFRLRLLVAREIKREYSPQQLQNVFVYNLQLSNLTRTVNIFRRSLYAQQLVIFLQNEYAAWLRGKQYSDCNRPTYFDCNREFVNIILDGDTYEKAIENLSAEELVTGYNLCFSIDPQLLSVLEIGYGMTDCQIKRLPKIRNRFVKEKIKQNSSYKIYKKYSVIYLISSILGKTHSMIISSVLFVIMDVMLVFFAIEWAVWKEIILSVIMLVIEFLIVFFGNKMMRCVTNKIYENSINNLMTYAGYVDVYRPDLKKKNLVIAGLKGFVINLLNTK